MSKKINIQYFARLREETGKTSETIETEAGTVSQLFEALAKQYQFSWSKENFKVAVNEEFQTWDYNLGDNDTVVFIQPVAGG